jgi:hypothetical protein
MPNRHGAYHEFKTIFEKNIIEASQDLKGRKFYGSACP